MFFVAMFRKFWWILPVAMVIMLIAMAMGVGDPAPVLPETETPANEVSALCTDFFGWSVVDSTDFVSAEYVNGDIYVEWTNGGPNPRIMGVHFYGWIVNDPQPGAHLELPQGVLHLSDDGKTLFILPYNSEPTPVLIEIGTTCLQNPPPIRG